MGSYVDVSFYFFVGRILIMIGIKTVSRRQTYMGYHWGTPRRSPLDHFFFAFILPSYVYCIRNNYKTIIIDSKEVVNRALEIIN